MKKCPFCAESIQDEAIKCRYCNSFLNAAPPEAAGAVAAAEPAAPVAAAAPPTEPAAGNAPPFAKAAEPAVPIDRKVIYDGSPSWRAYIGYYVMGAILCAVAIAIASFVVNRDGAAPVSHRVLAVIIPLAAVVVYFAGMHFSRKSTKFRVTNTVIEVEVGLLSKRIDVLQLWRCRDVRYKQNLVDRILGIAHVEVFAQDTTNPHLEIVGMPASRQLFEQLRDAIEIQRQAKNVYGVVS